MTTGFPKPSWLVCLVWIFPLLLLPIALVLVAQCFRTYRTLSAAGLPVVFWRPRFFNYQVTHSDKQLPSSSITNILPRMRRLGGPYGMYGTVYGFNTAVVHVAHPTPALAILQGHHSPQGATPPPTVWAVTTKLLRGLFRLKVSPSLSTSMRFHETGIQKSPAYNHFEHFCGQGVFTADGQDWKDKRTAVLHILLRRKYWQEELIRCVQDAAGQLVHRLSNIDTPADGGDTRDDIFIFKNKSLSCINVVPILQRATVGIIYQYLTHTKLHEESTPIDGAPIHCHDSQRNNLMANKFDTKHTNMGRQKTGSSKSSSMLLAQYLQSVIQIRMIILAQSRSLWFLLPRWIYRTFSSLFRSEEETMIPIRAFARQAVADAKPKSPLAELQKLPLYHKSPSRTTSSIFPGIVQDPSESSPITSNLLFETITLLFAGQDTSAATLSWTLHLLSLHPDIQRKLAAEIAGVQPSLPPKDVLQLTFLDAVLKESMRLYPVAPFVVRKITSSMHFGVESTRRDTAMAPTTDESVTLPKGALACIWIYSLHRNPEFWDDPDQFRPERWLTNPGGEKSDGGISTAYMPFAAGPRNCVGQPMAHIILRLLLAHLISNFTFQALDGEKRKDMQVGFTVLPSGGVPLVVHPREKPKRS